MFGKVYTVPCHDTILRTILFRHNTDQEAAMWPNTVEAHQSARAPRQHQDLATTMDAVSFFVTVIAEILPDGTNTNSFFLAKAALKTSWPQLPLRHRL